MQLDVHQTKLLRWVEAKEPVLGIFFNMVELDPMIHGGFIEKRPVPRPEGPARADRGGESGAAGVALISERPAPAPPPPPFRRSPSSAGGGGSSGASCFRSMVGRALVAADPPPLAEEGDHAQRGGGGDQARPLMRAPRSTVHRARQLRREMTLPEVLLWRDLRRGQLDGLLFRRQHPIGPYVLDFFCPAQALAVEVDGAVHDIEGQAAHDGRRDLWLARRGVRVLRFRAADVWSDEARLDVLATVAAAVTSSTMLRMVPLLRDAEEDQAHPTARPLR